MNTAERIERSYQRKMRRKEQDKRPGQKRMNVMEQLVMRRWNIIAQKGKISSQIYV